MITIIKKYSAAILMFLLGASLITDSIIHYIDVLNFTINFAFSSVFLIFAYSLYKAGKQNKI